jgi:hypothetical protein
MRKYFFIIAMFVSSFAYSQFDFQQLCIQCAEAGGYYCGDDPANWTQYAPDGCVPDFYINDGWDDCIDASDENGAEPTNPIDCIPDEIPCDTIFVDVPVIEYIYETIFETDTIIEIQVIEEEIFITDTVYVYEDVLDTMFIDVIEYVEIFVIDTIVETEFITEYLDCDTGLPCNTSIPEIIEKSKSNNLMYNLMGQVIRRPESIYIQDGKVKYILN